MMRVVLITNIISPYRIPFLNYLNKGEKIELRVIYIASQEKNRMWRTYFNEINYSFDVLKGFNIATKYRTIHLNYGLISKLRAYMPDIMVIGTDILSSPVSWVSLLYARKHGIKLIRYESQHKYAISHTGGSKRRIYSKYYSFFDSFFVYSGLTKEYLVSLGVDPHIITVGYNVGDTDYFSQETEKYVRSCDYLSERAKYPEVIFLYAGRLASDKNIVNFLRILREFDYTDIGLFILGDGVLKKEVQKIANEFKKLRIYIEGFKQKNECIRYFSLADIFVLPSLFDRSSIVVSEALMSGLFTIGSKYDGSSVSFIRQGENGFIVDPKDELALRSAIIKAYKLKKAGKLDRKRIRETMVAYTVEKYAERLSNLIMSHTR